MAKIPNFQKNKLRYGAHFAVMAAFDEGVATLCQQEPLLSPWYNAFKSALTHLDAAVKIARASGYTKEILKQDNRRDRLYVNGKITAEMWVDLGIEPQATAGRAVLQEVNIYKIDTKAQYDQETGLMINFLQPFETAEMQAHLATLGLTAVFTQMKAANEEVRRLLALRGSERAENAGFDLKPARQATDEAYDNLVDRINAYVVFNSSEAWNAFIAQWTAEIKRIKQQILNQQGGSGTNTNPGTSPDPSEEGENGNGGTTPDTPDNPGGGTSPDPSEGGENPDPDPNAGGGNGGSGDDEN